MHALKCRLGKFGHVAWRRERTSPIESGFGFAARDGPSSRAFAKSGTVTEETSALSTNCEPREPLEPRPAADVQPLVAERKPPREAVGPGRGRRLGLATGGLLVLASGWVAGSNTHLIDATQPKRWIDESATALSSALVSVQNAVTENWRSANNRTVAPAVSEKSDIADAFERVVASLNIKLDAARSSSESAAHDLVPHLQQLRVSIDRSQVELASRLTQVAERLERLERAYQLSASNLAQHMPASPAAPARSNEPQVERPSVGAAPTANVAQVRREPIVTTTRHRPEAVNGKALTERRTGAIGASRRRIGGVEPISPRADRSVEATNNGVITSRGVTKRVELRPPVPFRHLQRASPDDRAYSPDYEVDDTW